MTREESDRLYVQERIAGLMSGDSTRRALNFGLALDFMAERGTSVLLNWGEDTGCWELSWITGGRRFTAVSKEKHIAVRDVLLKVEEAAAGRGE